MLPRRLLQLITFQPYTCLYPYLVGRCPILASVIFWGQRSHKQVEGQMSLNVKVNLQDSTTVDYFNVSLISLTLVVCVCVFWFVE